MQKLVKCSVILLIQYVAFVHSERTHDKMYTPISGASCFRRLNGTHQTGCSSTSSGSVGVLHLIQKVEDFDFIINNPPSPPYAPIIPPYLFTRENILRLKNEAQANVSVILLVNNLEGMTSFSHELTCPNPMSSINNTACSAGSSESVWNPVGTGLLHEDFPFPIFYIADGPEIAKLVNCFDKFNNFDFETHDSRSLCSVEIKSFMSAAVSSEVCIRRTRFVNNLSPTRYCDPLQGRNIYGTLFPRPIVADVNKREVDPKEKIILVSCRMDTTSMFDGVGLGALDSLVSFATLISLAHTLSRILPEKKVNESNIMFVIFNGESYDYIGSQRLVYDIQQKAFPKKTSRTNPINFDNIEFMIDLGTLDTNNITLYSVDDKSSFKNVLLQKLTEYSKQLELNLNFKPATTTNLPPSSIHSFLRENISFPVMTMHSKPTNLFYHSIYDDASNANFTYLNSSDDYTRLMDRGNAFTYFKADSIQMRIRNLSSALALSLYEIVTKEKYASDDIANPILIDEFLHCFLESMACPLFKASSYPNSLNEVAAIPPMRYISVQGSTPTAIWAYLVLGFVLSQKHPELTEKNCTYLPYYWYAGINGTGECRLTTHNYSIALSPAFLIDDYDWKSGKYSTWTESTWSQFSARIFLRPSKMRDTLTLSIGLAVFILSFCLVFLISSRSEVLFENIPTRTQISEPAAC